MPSSTDPAANGWLPTITMTTPWASKLAGVTPGPKTPPGPSAVPTGAAPAAPAPSSAAPVPPTGDNKYNAAEVSAYLADTFNAYVQEAKSDKAGDKIKTYRSLEASSQWKTTKPARKDAPAMDVMGELNRSLARVQ